MPFQKYFSDSASKEFILLLNLHTIQEKSGRINGEIIMQVNSYYPSDLCVLLSCWIYYERVFERTVGLKQRQDRYFAVTSPGLEGVCAKELERLGIEPLRQLAGGVEFELSLIHI